MKIAALGVVHKLRLQEEGVDSSKMLPFCQFYKVENVNRGR